MVRILQLPEHFVSSSFYKQLRTNCSDSCVKQVRYTNAA